MTGRLGQGKPGNQSHTEKKERNHGETCEKENSAYQNLHKQKGSGWGGLFRI